MAGWLRNGTRVESWRFFDPPLPEVDPRHTFVANRADLGARVRAPRFDLSGEFTYVRIERLPTDAIGPGGLGTGAFYFASSGVPYSYQMFLSEMTASLHTADRRWTLTAGRMPFLSGLEGQGARSAGDSPSAPSAAPLEVLRRERLAGRLLGTFAFSQYQRRFDGARLDWNAASAYAGAAAFLVSQGGYEESANLTMKDVFVAGGFAGWRHGAAGETQAFVYRYRDRRAIDIRPDNANRPATSADIAVYSIGASHIGTRQLGVGLVDWLAWGTLQGGDWYQQSHRAGAFALEAGYQRPDVAWRPWLRAGVAHASGDDDSRDDTHGTFFPMLRDQHTYGPSMTYAAMNLRDVFAELRITPHARLNLRLESHHLRLSDTADRWYQGSGATASAGRFFGYSARPSSGETTLGTTVEATAALRLSRFWSINGYIGHMRGGPVVRGVFDSNRLWFWHVENVLEMRIRS
ncbi:MAG: alginate export family protein [Acidobacteria bacterium]|nr:alginate export family protein [Acidobacteriota bacterium]